MESKNETNEHAQPHGSRATDAEDKQVVTGRERVPGGKEQAREMKRQKIPVTK